VRVSVALLFDSVCLNGRPAESVVKLVADKASHIELSKQADGGVREWKPSPSLLTSTKHLNSYFGGILVLVVINM